MRFFKFPASYRVFLACLLTFSAVLGQDSLPPVEAISSDQKIRSGDSILVNVLEESSISGGFRVGNDGNINYPLLGRIKVEGLSIDQAAAEIEQLLEKDFIRDAIVSVTMANRQEYSVFVTGAVRSQGNITFDPEEGITLGRAVARVGGASETANTGNIEIQRSQDGELKKIRASLTSEQDLTLRDGDIVVIPSRPIATASSGGSSSNVIRPEVVVETGTILVLGQVSRPGLVKVPLDEGTDILEVIVNAGWFTRLARPSKVRVQRGGTDENPAEVFTVDVDKMNKSQNTETFLVYPGDKIFVPESIF